MRKSKMIHAKDYANMSFKQLQDQVKTRKKLDLETAELVKYRLLMKIKLNIEKDSVLLESVAFFWDS